jgi:hypothetical protein
MLRWLKCTLNEPSLLVSTTASDESISEDTQKSSGSDTDHSIASIQRAVDDDDSLMISQELSQDNVIDQCVVGSEILIVMMVLTLILFAAFVYYH